MDVVKREDDTVTRHYNIADLFELVAAESVPDRLALVGGDSRLTYRELDERTNRFAHHLLDAGSGRAPGWRSTRGTGPSGSRR